VEPFEERLSSGWEQALHDEINRLPERYRVVIVLCDLEGHTCEEVARRMGRPVGTVKSWRSRGRERLRQRLVRSGLTLGAGTVCVTSLAPEAAAAAGILSDTLTAGVVPAAVHVLVRGVFKAMILSKLRTAAAVIMGLILVSGGVGTAAWVAGGDPKQPGEQLRTEPSPQASDSNATPVPNQDGQSAVKTWPLSLRDAIRIGLKNAEIVCALPSETPNATKNNATDQAREVACTISPLNPSEDFQSFRLNVMELVRSIEQQYWILARNYVRLWAAEKTLHSTQAILKSVEEAKKSGRGSDADVAEAKQRLEGFRLDVATRTSDLTTTGRQLCNLLGLAPADGQRIAPITAPIEAKIEPDWDTSLKSMLEHYPDIIQARETLRAKGAESPITAELDKVARTVLPDLTTQEATLESSKAAHGSPALPEAGQLQQVIHQRTHSLARYHLEIDANYKQYQSAKKLRAAAADRLELQREFFEEGKTTIDKLLDALKLYGEAVAQEAEHKCLYNITVAVWEEAKGTLLDYDKITVVAHPKADKSNAGKPHSAKRDSAAVTVSFPTPAPAPAIPAPATPARDSSVCVARTGPAKGAVPNIANPGKTISFDVMIDVGGKPVRIRGSFSISQADPNEAAQSR
jgi:Sigma-70, region 4